MKSLLILGTLILLINGDSFPCEKKTNPHTETEYEYDLYQWRSAVAAALPQGAVNLSYNSAQVAADIYVVWKDAQVDADDERPAIARECPDALSRGGDLSIRCLV